MKCLCLVVLLSCVAFAQIQGPGSGDDNNNESNNDNNNNVNNNIINTSSVNNNNVNNNNESDNENEVPSDSRNGGSESNKNDGSDNNKNDGSGNIDNSGDSNNNNDGNVNNINNGFFNRINNGNVNNFNSGNLNSFVNGNNMGNINNMMGGNFGNLNMINGNMGNINNIMNGNFNNGNNNNNNNNNNFNNNNNNNGRRTMNNYNVGNPDFGNITRPCSTFDIDCIRRFFADHGHCKITYGPVPEPLYREQIISYVPRVNLTITLRKAKLRGVSNGRIEEFFVNQDTDKVVIAIEFRGLTISSNHTYFRIHRRSKEPIVVKDYSSVTYQSVIMTAIIPKIYNLQLDRTVVFSYVNDPNPPYQFGPRVTNSRDPEVQNTYAAFLLNPRANVQEIMLTDAPYYPPTYIQYNICDFGLKIF